MNWTTDSIPDQAGRLALITGANSGLGLETARALLAKGATVVLGCRSLPRAELAKDELQAAAASGVVPLSCWSLIWPAWLACVVPLRNLPIATAGWIC